MKKQQDETDQIVNDVVANIMEMDIPLDLENEEINEQSQELEDDDSNQIPSMRIEIEQQGHGHHHHHNEMEQENVIQANPTIKLNYRAIPLEGVLLSQESNFVLMKKKDIPNYMNLNMRLIYK